MPFTTEYSIRRLMRSVVELWTIYFPIMLYTHHTSDEIREPITSQESISGSSCTSDIPNCGPHHHGLLFLFPNAKEVTNSFLNSL